MIDAARIEFIEKEEKLFLRYELSAEEKISRVELEMLKNNRIDNILDIAEIYEDGKTVFLYDVTSKKQFSECFRSAFSSDQLYKMLQSFCKVWMCVDEYMLDRRHFILYPEVMYIQQDISELFIMVFPVYAENDKDKEIEFRMILAAIFSRIFYYDEQFSGFYLRLQEYISGHLSFTAKEFQKFLEQTYKEERGVLQPVSEAPIAPENEREDGKKIVHEEEAKAILQKRFEPINDEIIFLEDNIETSRKNSVTVVSKPLKGKEVPTNNFLRPSVKTGKVIVPVPSNKTKINNSSKTEILAAPKKKNKEKEEKPLRKGLFHIFGKKKEKQEIKPSEKENHMVVPTPIDSINNYRVPVNTNGQNLPQPSLMGTGEISQKGNQNNYEQKFQERVCYGADSVNSQNNRDNSQNPYPLWTLPIGKRKEEMQKESLNDTPENTWIQQKELDLDATMLMEEELDLDATTLISNTKPRSIPVLRSKETGEIIKITYSGFLVGRQKIRNGMVVNEKGKRQPDLILAITNISHSHAVFIKKDKEWYVVDQNSLNGTFVNEERLLPEQEKILQEGDILRFASEEYEYLMIKE